MGYKASDEVIAGRLRKVVQLEGGADVLVAYFDRREDDFGFNIVRNVVDSNLVSDLKKAFREIARNDPDLQDRNSSGSRAYAAHSAARAEEFLRTATAFKVGASALAYKEQIDTLKAKLKIV